MQGARERASEGPTLSLSGRVDHGQDACAECFRQRRPGIENALQVGIFFDFTGQGMGQVEKRLKNVGGVGVTVSV
jgi:hypothetical protein